jgi:predicted transcriptional regulator
MLNQSQMTVQLNPAIIARVSELAQNQQRSEDAIVEAALSGYLKHMAWLEKEIEKGREDFRQGRFYTDDEMRVKLEKMGVTLD